jgi:hypothetical protein
MDDKLASLTSLDGWWDTFLLISTLIVLIGVVGEVIADLTNWLDNCSATKRSVELCAALLLIAGIAGELLGEGKTASIGEQISGFLNVKAGEANDRAAAAEKEAAEFNERAANAELALAQLRENVKQRLLKPEQFSKIVLALSGKDIPKIGVIRTRDPEAGSFAIDIAVNLARAGLPFGVMDSNEETKALGFSDSRMFLYCPDAAAAKLIGDAFNDAGVSLAVGTEPFFVLPTQPPNSIYVPLRVPPVMDMPAYTIEPKK